MTEMIGNETLLKSLERIASSGRIPHGIILSGEEGTGKNLAAEYFAKLIKVSPSDTVRLKHEKPNLISVNDIRESVNNTVSIRPYSSEYKLYIIDEAEKMNIQAQNALLKTIEEPPGYVIIMLLTVNPEAFLQTVLSRCVLLKTLPLSNREVEEELRRRGIPEEKIGTAVRFSEGSIGKALLLSESDEFQEMVSAVRNILRKADSLQSADILAFNGLTGTYKERIYELLSVIRMWFSDVMLYKSGADESLIKFTEDAGTIISQSKKLDFTSLFKIENAVDEAESRLRSNVSFETVPEIMLLEIIKQFNR